jgi:hypothetical protein
MAMCLLLELFRPSLFGNPVLIETSADFFYERHQLSGKLWVVTQHRDAAIPLSGGRVHPDKPDCAHAGVIVSSTHPRAAAEKRLTIARLILNQVTDFLLIVWGKVKAAPDMALLWRR